MSEKINLARLKKFGHTFEISVDPDKALHYKKGELNDITEVLLAERIFTDAKKGLVASYQALQETFKTTDVRSIAQIIVKEGEIQHTAEFRTQEREQRQKRLVYLIHKQAVDPKTGYPHPLERIETALNEAKIHLDEHKTIEEQLDSIISKLRPLLPLKIEQKKITITVPAQFAGKAYATVKNNSTILRENWNNNGSWTGTVELAAGLYPEFLEKLNALTHGQVVVT